MVDLDVAGGSELVEDEFLVRDVVRLQLLAVEGAVKVVRFQVERDHQLERSVKSQG